MKRIAGIFFFMLPLFGMGQGQYGEISTNNIKWGLTNRGILFQNNGAPAFEAPKNGGVHAILSSGIWMAGKDNMGNLYVSAACYDTSGQDFFPGPIDRTSHLAADTANWNHLWITDSAEIAGHKSWYNNTGYTAPWGIQNWPGSYNGSADYNPVLAPYIDLNGNNIYEPDSGEVPYIQGKSAAYFLFNDVYGTHTQSGGQGLGIEVYGMAHVTDISPNLYTVYVNYRFVNRSGRTYDSLYLGVFTDFKLGRPDDNFISTDSSRNLIYAYNANAYDSGYYGDKPPVVGMRFLNQKMDKSMSFFWDNSDYGWPSTPRHYFQYLAGRFKNEEKIADPASSQNSYIFAGDPCNNTGWTEFGSVNSFPGRRNGLGSIGPRTLADGDYIRLDVAYIFSKSGTSAFDNVCEQLQDADAVEDYWKQVLAKVKLPVKDKQLGIYPNPATSSLTIQLENLHDFKIYDLTGKEMLLKKETPEKVSVAELIPGVYIIRAIDQNGQLYTSRFVKVD